MKLTNFRSYISRVPWMLGYRVMDKEGANFQQTVEHFQRSALMITNNAYLEETKHWIAKLLYKTMQEKFHNPKSRYRLALTAIGETSEVMKLDAVNVYRTNQCILQWTPTPKKAKVGVNPQNQRI